jgi:hypothetical protein
MPALTCRRYPERRGCWHVYYGDVQIGTIARILHWLACGRDDDGPVLSGRDEHRAASLPRPEQARACRSQGTGYANCGWFWASVTPPV